ncbi:hypothetical protein OROMI_026032 [Orobanche minor]
MFQNSTCLRILARKYHFTKRSRSRRANDGKNLMLNSTNGGFSRKRKTGQGGAELSQDKVRKKRKTSENNGVYDRNLDRISDLPEPIIHHIFTFMKCTKDVARTSILSKKWRNMYNSYLTFDFDERWFRIPKGVGKHNRIKARELQKKKFKSYVDRSLAVRLNPVPCIDKFRLYVNNIDNRLRTCIEHWLCAAADKNVKELDIQLNTKEKHFVLPEAVFLSASVIALKLSGPVISFLFNIRMSRLRILSIKGSTIVSDYVIKLFETGCPLLEDLRFVCCKAEFNIAISSLVKLRRVEVHDCGKVSYIQIAAPSLETFWYHADKYQECRIDLKGSGNLKNLTLKDWKMTDTAFQDLISMCPLLEKLVLQECNSLGRLAILSERLKRLALIRCVEVQEINVDAPNLYSFEYSGLRMLMPFSSMNVPGLHEAKLSFGPVMRKNKCIVYQRPFGIFDRSKGFKLIIYTHQEMKIYEEPKEADIIPDHVCKLVLTASLASVRKVVDSWLRECRGRSLILVSPCCELRSSIQTLIADREDKPSCCGLYSNQCWRHYIADVKIQTYTALPALHCMEGKKDPTDGKKAIIVGPWGGNGGTNWDDGFYNGIREIILKYDRCIDSILIIYDKNEKPVSGHKHGGVGGTKTAEIKLQFPEEFLTDVTGHYCPVVHGGSPVIRSLMFRSNRRMFGPYGVEEGTPFFFPMEGGQIIGFKV